MKNKTKNKKKKEKKEKEEEKALRNRNLFLVIEEYNVRALRACPNRRVEYRKLIMNKTY